MKKMLLTLSLIVISNSALAGNLGEEYSYLLLNCKNKNVTFDYIIQHEVLAGIKSVTQNIFIGDELDSQHQRAFKASGMRSDSRIIFSQERGALTPETSAVALFFSTKDFLAKKKIEATYAIAKVQDIVSRKITEEKIDCEIKSVPVVVED